MRITPLIVCGFLALGASSCNNPASGPSAPASEATVPANDVTADPAAINAVMEAPSTNAVAASEPTNTMTNATTDDPRGNPDRREAPPAEQGSEPK